MLFEARGTLREQKEAVVCSRAAYELQCLAKFVTAWS